VSDWQPISTAPKGADAPWPGPRILLWYDFGVALGCWQVDHWRRENAPNEDSARRYQPTHWAPLPEGPQR